MRVFGQVLSWTIRLGLIFAVGAVTFVVIRHEPRCVIRGPLRFVHLADDGNRMITFRQTANETFGPLEVWDTHTGRIIHQMHGTAKVQQSTASPDGKYVATLLDDQILRLIDWRAGTEWRFDDLGRMAHFRFSEKSRWLIGTASDRPTRLRIIDLVDRRATSLESSWLSYSEDERLGFTWDGKETAYSVWDLKTSKMLGTLPFTVPRMKAYEEEWYQPSIDPSPDGGFAVTYRYDLERPQKSPVEHSGVDVWDLATFKHRFRRDVPRAGILNITFSPDGRMMDLWLAEVDKPSKVEVIDLESGKLLFEFPMIDGLGGGFSPDGTVGDFSPDGSLWYFAHSRTECKLTLFDTATGAMLWEKPTSGLMRFFAGNDALWHQQSETTIELLDPRTGQVKSTIRDSIIPYTYRALTPDGRYFLVHSTETGDQRPLLQRLLEKIWPDWFGGADSVAVIESATHDPRGNAAHSQAASRRMNMVISCTACAQKLADT